MRNGMIVSSTCDAGRPAAEAHRTRTSQPPPAASNIGSGTYLGRVVARRCGIAVARLALGQLFLSRGITVASLIRSRLTLVAALALTFGAGTTSFAQIIVPGYPYPAYRYAAPDA